MARGDDLHGEQVRGAEAWVDGDEPLHAVQEQAGANEQDERECDLCGDERAAREEMHAGDAPRRLLQRGLQIAARDEERGDAARGETDERDESEGEEEGGGIECDGVEARKLRGRERDDGVYAQDGGGDAERAAEEGEQEVFCNQLAHDMTA